MNWDLTSYFPQFNGPAMVLFKESLKEDIAKLQKTAANPAPLEEENVTVWEKVFIRKELNYGNNP